MRAVVLVFPKCPARTPSDPVECFYRALAGPAVPGEDDIYSEPLYRKEPPRVYRPKRPPRI